MDIVFIISGLLVTLFIMGFAITSFYEKEKRAGVVGVIVSMSICLVWFSVGLTASGVTLVFTVFFWIVLITAGLFLYLPIGNSEPLKIDLLKTERYDERHVIFGRMCLAEGDWQYDEYYTNLNPKMKKTDDSLRAMPVMGAPGGKYANPLDSPYVDAVFEYISKFNHLAEPGPPLNEPVSITPIEAAKRLKCFAKQLGAIDVRITELKDYHVYTHAGRQPHNWGEKYKAEHKYAIVFTTEMDHEMVRCAPLLPGSVETAIRYMTAANIGIAMAIYIRELGYRARAHVDGNYQVLTTAIAHDAGIGELSRLGLVMTKGEGARVRLAAVTTDIPLEVDEPVNLGIQHFCEICKKCAANCPSGSIDHGRKKEIRGVVKWQSNMETCYQFWRRFGTDCTICMAVCPFSKPDTFYHKLIKAFIFRNAFARRAALFLDDLLYSKTPRHTNKPDWFSQTKEKTGLAAERASFKTKQF
jgi:reductive dehalogenase